jgi:hypothetical protein
MAIKYDFDTRSFDESGFHAMPPVAFLHRYRIPRTVVVAAGCPFADFPPNEGYYGK